MPKGNLTGLISAVPFEARLLMRKIKSRKRLSPSITTGRVGASMVAHISSGMGIANASHAATVLIERFGPSRVIVFGIGGAYPGSRLCIGDVVIAETEVYADTGVLLKGGMKGVKETGIELLKRGTKKFYNEFPLDARIAGKALRNIGGLKAGVFATVSASTGTLKRAREIKRRFGAVCENMEGAAVAHVCARYGIPVLEIRGISNIVPQRDKKQWNIEAASENCQKALIGLLTDVL